jgi:hypothetical protein
LHRHIIGNILSLKHIIDNSDKSITMIIGEGSQPLELFCDACYAKYSLLTLFYGHPRPSLACSYQDIVQNRINKYK